MNYILYLFILCSITNIAIAQKRIDEIPWENKKFLKNISINFTSPDTSYTRVQAIIEYQKVVTEYQKNLALSTNAKTLQKDIKIYEGAVKELINKLDTQFFQAKDIIGDNLEIYEDSVVLKVKNEFIGVVEDLYVEASRALIHRDPSVNFERTLETFKSDVVIFKRNLEIKEIQIVALRVDSIIIKILDKNVTEFKNKFDNLIIEGSINFIENQENLNSKFEELWTSTVKYDSIILKKIYANAEIILNFNEKVNRKIDTLNLDLAALKTEVENNLSRIKGNEDRISRDLSQTLKKQLIKEIEFLRDENAFKLGVIYEVVSNYNKLNKDTTLVFKRISDKLEILRLKHGNSSTYRIEKRRLENFKTLEEVKYNLAYGREAVDLARNMGFVSKSDYKNATRAIEIGSVLATAYYTKDPAATLQAINEVSGGGSELGNVILGGAMAYFTGNPIAGLQAINGAFSMFGGGDDPGQSEFSAIMEQFRVVNKKLDEINRKVDTLNKNIINLTNLTINLHQENQKRFDKVEQKLEQIQQGIDNITGLIYAERGGPLQEENLVSIKHRIDSIKNSKNIDNLKSNFNENASIRNVIGLVYKHSESPTVDSKPFIHYRNRNRQDTYWEENIYKPMLVITSNNSLNVDIIKLKNIPYYIYDFPLSKTENESFIIPELNTNIRNEKLIHPQSLIWLTILRSIFDPYYYFSSINSNSAVDHSIPDINILTNINYQAKNRDLKEHYIGLLNANQIAISQTNIISGVPILSFVYKHITDLNFNSRSQKDTIYNLLDSENYYLKVNLSNYILFEYINQHEGRTKSLSRILNCNNCADSLISSRINSFNRDFSNKLFKLVKKDNNVVLTLNPIKLEGGDLTKEIHLPLPPFDYIYENRAIYPSYLESLYNNKEYITNKIIQYDMVDKLNQQGFINLKLLN